MDQGRDQEENKRFPEIKKNRNTIYQNLWVVSKAILRGKFKAINTYIKKKIKISNNFTSHLKELEKEK